MIKSLSFIIAVMLHSGCVKKNHTAPTMSSMSGTWEIVTDSLTTYTNGVAGIPSVTNLKHSFTMKFDADGKGAIITKDAISNFTYTLSGDTVVISFAKQTSDGVVTPAFTEKPVIKQLDSNNLYLVHDGSSSGKNGDVESVHLTR